MITSVYISNERIQVLTGATVNKKHIDVKSCMFISLPEKAIVNGVITNEIAVKEALEKLWGKYDISKKDVYLVIDSGTILNKKIKTPSVLPVSAIQALIQEEFKEIEGFSNFLFDYSVLEDGKQGKPEVLCNAIGKELIASYIRTFDSVGIKLKSIDTSINCELKVFRTNSNMINKDCIVVILDKNNMTSILHINGSYNFSNRSRLLDQRGTEQSKIEIARNISSIIQFARSESSRKNLTNMFICGITDEEESLCDELSAMIGADVIAIPTCPEITYQGSTDSTQFLLSDYLYAVGNLIRL
ncbi:MAG: pilus assembly protein PilM [Oscillospiraceae bacterium]